MRTSMVKFETAVFAALAVTTVTVMGALLNAMFRVAVVA
jgi:hypothetical protein